MVKSNGHGNGFAQRCQNPTDEWRCHLPLSRMLHYIPDDGGPRAVRRSIADGELLLRSGQWMHVFRRAAGEMSGEAEATWLLQIP